MRRLLLVLPLLLAGCLTASKPVTPPTLLLTAEPEPMSVYYSNARLGTTPLRLSYPIPPGAVTVFHPSYVPVVLNLQQVLPGSNMTVTSEPQNGRLLGIFQDTAARFVYRANMDKVMIEPYNREAKLGSSYILPDPITGRDIQFVVQRVEPRYVVLLAEDTRIYLPVAYPIEPSLSALMGHVDVPIPPVKKVRTPQKAK